MMHLPSYRLYTLLVHLLYYLPGGFISILVSDYGVTAVQLTSSIRTASNVRVVLRTHTP